MRCDPHLGQHIGRRIEALPYGLNQRNQVTRRNQPAVNAATYQLGIAAI